MSIKGNWRRHGSEVVTGWCQRFFSRRFAAQCSVAPNEKKNLWHPGYPCLESPGKGLLVLESAGNLLNSSEKFEMCGRQ